MLWRSGYFFITDKFTSPDGAAMLIQYDFTDGTGASPAGYFWFSPDDGTLRAPFTLPAPSGDTGP